MVDPYGSIVRVFHALIGILIIVLAITGFSIFFRHDLGLQDYKSDFLFIHIWTAYTTILIVGLRVAWSLRSKDQRGRLANTVLSRSQLKDIRAKVRRRVPGKPLRFAGRSLLSRGIVSAFVFAGCIMVPTGLIRAGTDLYHPPLGGLVKAYLAADGVEPDSLRPRSKEGVNPYRADRVMKAKIVVGQVHIYTGFFIVFLILLHTFGQFLREWTSKDGNRGRARVMLFGSKSRDKPSPEPNK